MGGQGDWRGSGMGLWDYGPILTPACRWLNRPITHNPCTTGVSAGAGKEGDMGRSGQIGGGGKRGVLM
jgi:hypothetical protein